MSLLADLTTVDADRAFLEGAQRVVDRLAQLPAPRSLSELRLDDADVAWLFAWARSLTRPWVSASLLGPRRLDAIEGTIRLRRLEAFGCLFLLIAAESARRDAREGAVWATVQACFSEPVQKLLTFAGHQPTAELKDAMEAAARRLGLRHVFGVEGTQSYYVTVYLQFGFTRRGMAKLPHWLVGALQPEAVQHLLGEQLASDSFRRLWRALREYRRKNLHERQLRAIAADSPWVLPDWVDDLVHQARAKPELGVSAPGERGGAAPTEIGFLDGPMLCWNPPERPTFTARLANLAYFDLSRPRYEIRHGKVILATLLRQDDDTYLHPDAVELSGDTPYVELSLVGDDGSLVAAQDLRLWDLAEDVSAFDQAGRPFDAWEHRLDPGRPYLLLTAPDLQIEPPVSGWQLLGNGVRRLTRLPAGWQPQLRVLLDEHELWTPLLVDSSAGRRPEPDWIDEPTIVADTNVQIGGSLSIGITDLPVDVEVAYARLAGEPWRFDWRDGAITLAPVEITVEHAIHGLPVQIGLVRGQERGRLQELVTPRPKPGAARATDDGWAWIDSSADMTVEEARQTVIRPFLGTSRHGATAALMEGFTFSRRVDATPRPFGVLGGFGAPLGLYPSPYNAQYVLAPLADAVVDPGIVRGLERSDELTLRLCLSRALEPDAAYRVTLWQTKDKMRVLPSDRLRSLEPGVWELERLPVDPDGLLLAVDYQGERLGTWWPSAARSWCPPCPDIVPPGRVAALLRWMRVPLLHRNLRPALESFARAHPGDCLAAWLRDPRLPNSFTVPAPSEEWFAAVREMFWLWEPDPAAVASIATTFQDEPGTSPLVAVVAGLQRDPMLLHQILRVWLPSGIGATADQDADVRASRCLVAGLPLEATEAELAQAERAILHQAAEVMGVDRAFLEQGIVRRALGGTLTAIDTFNLHVALGVAPFRALLALHALTAFARRLRTPTPISPTARIRA